MKFYTIQELSEVHSISEVTLKARSRALGFDKIAGRWLLTDEQVKKLLDPSLHKRGKRAKKAPEN